MGELARSYCRRRTFYAAACCALVSLLLAEPAGASRNPLRFEPTSLLPGEGVGVAVGYLTGDGRKDIAYAGYNWQLGGGLFVLAQQGNNSFAPPIRYEAHGGTLRLGDLNRDGRLDVAAGSVRGIEYFLQRGGRLSGPHVVPNTANSLLVEMADMNGDGRTDFVYSVNGGWIRLARNTGKGFAITTISGERRLPYDIDVGDVTGDGRKDIVAVWDPTFTVFRQRRNGTFQRVTYSSFYNLESVEIADVTGDGRNDISLSIARNSPAWIKVYEQNSAGGLKAAASYDSYQVPETLESADLDRNGYLDLVTYHPGWITLGVYLQGFGGTLEAEDLYSAPYSGNDARNLALGDVTGDGRADIVLAVSAWGTGLYLYRQLPRAPAATVRYAIQRRTGSIVPGVQDLGLHCDDCAREIALPFPVRFYGQPHTSAWVSSNGPLVFAGSKDSWANYCLPTIVMERALFPYWDDLSTERGDRGVFTRTLGSAPTRTFVIEWRTEYLSQYFVNFEVLFEEGSDVISVIYGPTDFPRGRDATAGIQYDQGNFTELSCTQPGVLVEGLRVDYVPTPNPLPSPPDRRCTVPAIVGKRLAPARRAIRRARCKVGRVRRTRSRRPRGLVVGQKPRAGAIRPVGSRVHLVVSRGRR